MAVQNSFAQNSVTGVSINLYPTFHHVGVQMEISGDANNNSTAGLEVSINGAGFIPAHKLSKTTPTNFVGTAFNVQPGTQVELRVTLSDPDGVSDGVHQASMTTRSEVIPTSAGLGIHVAVGGNDSSGNGSSSLPFATIQMAVDQAGPGDKVLIHAGRYHQFTEIFDKPGTSPTNPITITNAGDGEVLIDGTDLSYNNPAAWTSEGNHIYSSPLAATYYIGIDGNRLWRYDTLNQLQTLAYNTNGGFYSDTINQKVYLRLPDDNAPTGHTISVSTLHYGFDIFHVGNIVVDGLLFRNFNVGEHSTSISVSDQSIDCWIVNSTFENMETAIRLEGYVEDLVVMDNDFSDQGIANLSWEIIKEDQWWLERGAMYIGNDGFSGRGIIFYRNYVHEMFDGVKIVGGEDDTPTHPNDSDVVENIFSFIADDGIETDGWCSNTRIVNNRFENLLVGISVAPAITGPTYIIGNEISDMKNISSQGFETMAVKFNYDGTRSGDVFIYHNTATTYESGMAAFSMSNSSNWDNVVMKNNIWKGTEWALYHWLDNTAQLEMTQDFDLLYNQTSTLVFFDDQEYSTPADYYNGTGFCQNCLSSDPLFVNGPSGNLSLSASSPAIDTGTIIFGINDAFIGSGPDIGAREFEATTSVEVPEPVTKLTSNFPNPFNPRTTISYTIEAGTSSPDLVQLAVYNVMGQRVKTLVSQPQPSGQYTVVWNGDDEVGKPQASGTYFYQLRTGGTSESRKMMLVR